MKDSEFKVDVTKVRNPRGSTPDMYDSTGYPLPLVHDSAVYTPYGDGREEDNRDRTWWPVPWINGRAGLGGDFFSFREDHRVAESDRLCCVCGDGLRISVLIGSVEGLRETAGGWAHPKCLSLTISVCPHFTREARTGSPTGFLWVGPGIGVVSDATFVVDEVHPEAVPLDAATIHAMAKADPWGDTDLTHMVPDRDRELKRLDVWADDAADFEVLELA